MRAQYTRKQYADYDACTPEQRLKTVVEFERGKPVHVFPAGTIVEGDEAILRVKTGVAIPLDDECKAACGLNDNQISALQLQNEMASLGINDKNDQELYKAKVILGYDDKLEYIKGPNWDAYQKAKAESEGVDDIA